MGSAQSVARMEHRAAMRNPGSRPGFRDRSRSLHPGYNRRAARDTMTSHGLGAIRSPDGASRSDAQSGKPPRISRPLAVAPSGLQPDSRPGHDDEPWLGRSRSPDGASRSDAQSGKAAPDFATAPSGDNRRAAPDTMTSHGLGAIRSPDGASRSDAQSGKPPRISRPLAVAPSGLQPESRSGHHDEPWARRNP